MTNSEHLPLRGRTALVTGVSRRRGIGYAIAVRLAELGADLFIHHHRAHDTGQPWSADDLEGVREGVRAALRPGAAFGDLGLDLADPKAPERLVAAARELTGSLHVLVCNHARSGGDGSLLDMTAEKLDGHWSVNTRSTLLLTSHFARAFAGTEEAPAARPGDRRGFSGPLDEHATGRVFWTTSGQIHGPMPGEVAYAASKAALAGLTATAAAELLPLGVVLNTVDPGPVNTGYLDPESTDRDPGIIERVLAATPFGRLGHPTDPARLVGWLASDGGRWVVGQIITTDGGFSLGTDR
ncbi:SDR family oxidoreductase [Nocardiopsis sp. CC223A]|uniref:SDR family oxidoreductase n=1 Tax=Nocardiopsis sp. CC223A TaxID=3044051 RepID=UPI00278BBFC6|nr:SDR family oxidoreductase [Nocardiopsis sp. CC223A]